MERRNRKHLIRRNRKHILFRKGEIVILILKMKLMIISTYLIFMTKQITLLTKHQIISVMELKKRQM